MSFSTNDAAGENRHGLQPPLERRKGKGRHPKAPSMDKKTPGDERIVPGGFLSLLKSYIASPPPSTKKNIKGTIIFTMPEKRDQSL
jgi:hypothetical protein